MLEAVEHLPGSLIKLILLYKVAYHFLESLRAFDLILEERKVNRSFFSVPISFYVFTVFPRVMREGKRVGMCVTEQ